ncbi:ATPase/DNA packaging protein [Paenibacillus sp. NPDC058177]|uniref:ATPase/DNA packaging protein n=1 Tax=Paenibacillus sp. NPDC058177 TaxID=3346369 RepID=UPI0036D8C094
MNEEQVKNTVIVPFFSKIGLLTDNVEFETHLTINIPRQGGVKIGEEIAKNVYSDILYKALVNGRLTNVILVEVKRENHTLNDRDKEQAINYARLLDEIAPYCVVTNGKMTKIFDTITKDELTNSDLSKSNFVTAGYNLTMPEDIREVALRTFIGLDRTNLLRFCQLQSERNFQDIKSEKLSSKSIIDELHCNRAKYIDEFKNFLKSGSKIYAIIGNSGYGKTNYLYSLWQLYRDRFPILFYNAGLLNQRVITSIQEDFHFLLDKEYSLAELIRRFDDITKNNGDQRFFIVIDGLDEHPNTMELRNELNDLIKKVQDTNIHLIISCKTTDESNDIWSSLTHFKGSLNSFGENIYTSRNLSYLNRKGVYVDKLDEKELTFLWERYKKTFRIKGSLKSESRELAKQPFLMRMLAEVYQDQEIASEITEIELYKKWLHQKLGQTSSPDMTRLVLIKIVNQMVEEKRENLEFDLLLNLLSIVDNGFSHFQELLRIGVILVTKDSNEIQYISISNNALMKYIYCYEISKWHTKLIIDLIQPFNSYICDEYLRQYPIFLITFKQSQFKNEREIWSETYSKSDQPLCISCNTKIVTEDKVTIVLRVDKNDLSNENLGNFHIIHEKCAWNGPSMFDVRPEINHAILNCEDFLGVYKIIRLLKSMTDSQKADAARRAKKEELQREPHFKFLPLITSKGEPFWAIMEFMDEVNSGNMRTQKINGEDHLLFFDTKAKAEFYLALNPINEDSEIKERVIGVERKYVKGLEGIYRETSVNMPSIVVLVDFEMGGKAMAIPLEFTEVINVVNSGLSFLDYMKRKHRK